MTGARPAAAGATSPETATPPPGLSTDGDGVANHPGGYMRATLVASTTTRTCKLCRGSGCLRCARTGLISDDHEAFAFQADWTRWDIMVDHDEASVILVPLRGKTQGYRWTTQQARELALALTDALNKLDAETLEYGAIHG